MGGLSGAIPFHPSPALLLGSLRQDKWSQKGPGRVPSQLQTFWGVLWCGLRAPIFPLPSTKKQRMSPGSSPTIMKVAQRRTENHRSIGRVMEMSASNHVRVSRIEAGHARSNSDHQACKANAITCQAILGVLEIVSKPRPLAPESNIFLSHDCLPHSLPPFCL